MMKINNIEKTLEAYTCEGIINWLILETAYELPSIEISMFADVCMPAAKAGNQLLKSSLNRIQFSFLL